MYKTPEGDGHIEEKMMAYRIEYETICKTEMNKAIELFKTTSLAAVCEGERRKYEMKVKERMEEIEMDYTRKIQRSLDKEKDMELQYRRMKMVRLKYHKKNIII